MVFINNLIVYIVGFTMLKTNELANGIPENITLFEDLKNGSLVLTLSVAITLLVGIASSIVLAKMESIRKSPISEMLFILFITFFLSCIAYMDEKWDYISEEVSILVFGVFFSVYVRYNFSFSSTRRFR